MNEASREVSAEEKAAAKLSVDEELAHEPVEKNSFDESESELESITSEDLDNVKSLKDIESSDDHGFNKLILRRTDSVGS